MLKVYGDAFMIATRMDRPGAESATPRVRSRRRSWLARALGKTR